MVSKAAESPDGGMTTVDLTMDANTGKWVLDTSAFQSPFPIPS